MPSVAALVALGNSDLDDPPPVEPASLVDRRLYCPSCRRWINLRRGVVLVVVLFALTAVVWFIAL